MYFFPECGIINITERDTMKEYRATLQYTRFYSIILEADDIDQAQRIAQNYADLEDVDINNSEYVYVVGVERVEEDE